MEGTGNRSTGLPLEFLESCLAMENDLPPMIALDFPCEVVSLRIRRGFCPAEITQPGIAWE